MRLSWTKAPSVVQGNTISFNSVNARGSGGGIGLTGTQAVQIIGNKFEGNDGAVAGGGLICYGAETVIKGNEFIGNNADSSGGGLYIEESNNSTITGNFFKANHAKYGGGMISFFGNYLVTNSIFVKNTAHWGGGMFCLQLPTQSYFTRIINNTIAGNVADTAGAIASLYGEVVLMNTICWGNRAPHGTEIEMWGGTLNVAYSDIRLGADGIAIDSVATINWLAGNKDEDPLLVADSLSNGSLCINAGIEAYDFGNGIVSKCPDKDINGRVRPYPRTRPDMGAWESVGTVGVASEPVSRIPKSYALDQNYPNPFNPSTTIEFALPKSGFVTLKIYDLLGNEVATLVSEKLPAGKHQRVWEAKGSASGVYLYRIEVGEFVQNRKLVLLR
jgi:parallel beta-helix repeat protein